MAGKSAMAAGIAIIVIIIAAVAIIGLQSASHVSPSTSPTTSTTAVSHTTTVSSGVQAAPVILTDPAIVPQGTTSLVINYSSIRVQLSGSSSGWVNAAGSGSINLLSLVNSSKVIGSANIPVNSTVDMVSFNVTSAEITINGTTSSVTVPNRNVTAHITGASKLNATSGFLMDLSPTIATIYTSNSTIFVMVPSVRAIVIGGKNVSSHASIGSSAKLNASVKTRLDAIKPNISIVSSSIISVGNRTQISVTVKDNSNSSVMLRHMLVFGNYSVVITPLSGFNTTVMVGADGHINQNGSSRFNISEIESGDFASASADIKDSANVPTNVINGSVSGNVRGNTGGNVISTVSNVVASNSNAIAPNGSTKSPSTSNESANASEHDSAEFGLVKEGIAVQHMRVFNFLLSSNGTMFLPSGANDFTNSGFGYNLSAGATQTFTFNGTLSFGDGHISITPQNGTAYKVVVGGEESAAASMNVTAT